MQESRATHRSLWLSPALLTLTSGGRRYALLIAAVCFILYLVGFSDIALSSYSGSWPSFKGIGAGGSRKRDRENTQTAWRNEAERSKFAERVNDARFRYWTREESSEGRADASEYSNGAKDREEAENDKNSSLIIPPTSISSSSTSSATPRLYRHPIVSCVNHVDHGKVPSDLIDTHAYYRDRLQCYCLDPHEKEEESASDANVGASFFSTKESAFLSSSQLFFPSKPMRPPPRSCVLRARKAIIYKPRSPKGKGWAQQPRTVKGTVRAKEPWWSLRAFKTYPQYNEIIIGAPDETRSFILRIDVPFSSFSSSGISEDGLRPMHNSPSSTSHFDEENKRHLTYFEQPLFVRSVWGGGTKVESRKGTVRVTPGNPLASLSVTHDYRRHPTLLIPTAFPSAPSTSSSSSSTTKAKEASAASTLYAFEQTIGGPSSAMAVLTTRLILDEFYGNEDYGKHSTGGGEVGAGSHKSDRVRGDQEVASQSGALLKSGNSGLPYTTDGDHKSLTLSSMVDLQTYPYRYENGPSQTQVSETCGSAPSPPYPLSKGNTTSGDLPLIIKVCRGMSEAVLNDALPPAQCGHTAYHFKVEGSEGKEEEDKTGSAVGTRKRRCQGKSLYTYITPELLVLDSFHDRFRRSMTAENAVNGGVTYGNEYSHLKALEWWGRGARKGGTVSGGGGGLPEGNCASFEPASAAALAGFCQHYLEEASVTATEDLWVGTFSGQMSGLVAGSDKRGSGAKAVRRAQAIFNYEQYTRMAWQQQQLDAPGEEKGEKKGDSNTTRQKTAKRKTKASKQAPDTDGAFVNTTCTADSLDQSLSPSTGITTVPPSRLLERFAPLCPLSQGQRLAYRHALRQMRYRVGAEGSVLGDFKTKATASEATGGNATSTNSENSTQQQSRRGGDATSATCHVQVIDALPQASSLGKHILVCPMIVKSSSSTSASAMGTNTSNTTETNNNTPVVPLEHLVLHALVMPLDIELPANSEEDTHDDGKKAPKNAARRANPPFSFATSITETLNSKKRMRRRKGAAPTLSSKDSGGISKKNFDLLERFNKVANGGLTCEKRPPSSASSSLSQADHPPAVVTQEGNASSGFLAKFFEGILGGGIGGQSQASGGLRSTSTDSTDDRMHSLNDSDLLTSAAAAAVANPNTTVQLRRMPIQDQIKRLRGVNLLVVADDAAGEVATWAYLLGGGDGKKRAERGGEAAIWSSRGNPATIVLLTNATLFVDTSGALLTMRAPELNPNVRVIAFIYQQGRLPSFAKLREAYDRPWRAETILVGCECEMTRVALYKDLEPLC